MQPVIYDSAAGYIESATTIEGRITAIEAIITALLTTAANAAANEYITEYSLDDGQTKIRTAYRGTAAIMASIKSFESLKQYYMNKVNGRVFRLVDGKNFTGQ